MFDFKAKLRLFAGLFLMISSAFSMQTCLLYSTAELGSGEIRQILGSEGSFAAYSLSQIGWQHLVSSGFPAMNLRSSPLTGLKRGQGYFLKTSGSCPNSSEIFSSQNLYVRRPGWVLFGFGNSNPVAFGDLQVRDKTGALNVRRLVKAYLFDQERGFYSPRAQEVLVPGAVLLLQVMSDTSLSLSEADTTVTLDGAPVREGMSAGFRIHASNAIEMSQGSFARIDSSQGLEIRAEVQAGDGDSLSELYWKITLEDGTEQSRPVALSPGQGSAHPTLRFTAAERGARLVSLKARTSKGHILNSDQTSVSLDTRGLNLYGMYDRLGKSTSPQALVRANIGQVETPTLPASFASARLDRINLRVSASDMSPLSLQFSGNETSARIQIPFGSNRLMELEYLDPSGDVLRRGSKSFDATAPVAQLVPEPVPLPIPVPVASTPSAPFLTEIGVSFGLSSPLTGAQLVIYSGSGNPKTDSVTGVIRTTAFSTVLSQSTTYQVYVETASGLRSGIHLFHYVKTTRPQVLLNVTGLVAGSDEAFEGSARVDFDATVLGSTVFYSLDGNNPVVSGLSSQLPASVSVTESTTLRYVVVSPFGLRTEEGFLPLRKVNIPNIQVTLSNDRTDFHFLNEVTVNFTSQTPGRIFILGQEQSLPHQIVVTQSGEFSFTALDEQGFSGPAQSIFLTKVSTPTVEVTLDPALLANRFIDSIDVRFESLDTGEFLRLSTGAGSDPLFGTIESLPVEFTYTTTTTLRYIVEDARGFRSPLQELQLQKETLDFELMVSPQGSLQNGFTDFVIVSHHGLPSGQRLVYTTDSQLPLTEWTPLQPLDQVIFYDSVDFSYTILDANDNVISQATLPFVKVTPRLVPFPGNTGLVRRGSVEFEVSLSANEFVEIRHNGNLVPATVTVDGGNSLVISESLPLGEGEVEVRIVEQDGPVVFTQTFPVSRPILNSFFNTDPTGLHHQVYNHNIHGSFASLAYDSVRDQSYFLRQADGKVFTIDDAGVLRLALDTPAYLQQSFLPSGLPFSVSDGRFQFFLSRSNGLDLVRATQANGFDSTYDEEYCSQNPCQYFTDYLVSDRAYQPQNLTTTQIDIPIADNGFAVSINSMIALSDHLYVATRERLLEIRPDLSFVTLVGATGLTPPTSPLQAIQSIQESVLTIERINDESLMVVTFNSSAQMVFHQIGVGGLVRGQVQSTHSLGSATAPFNPNQPLSQSNFPIDQVVGINVVQWQGNPVIFLNTYKELYKVQFHNGFTHEIVAGHPGTSFTDQVPARLSQLRGLGDIYTAGESLVVAQFPRVNTQEIQYNQWYEIFLATGEVRTLFQNRFQRESEAEAVRYWHRFEDTVVTLEQEGLSSGVFVNRPGQDSPEGSDEVLYSPDGRIISVFPLLSEDRLVVLSSAEVPVLLDVELNSGSVQPFNPVTVVPHADELWYGSSTIASLNKPDPLKFAVENSLGIGQIPFPLFGVEHAYDPYSHNIYFFTRHETANHLYVASLENPFEPVQELPLFQGLNLSTAQGDYLVDTIPRLKVVGDKLAIFHQGSVVLVQQGQAEIRFIHSHDYNNAGTAPDRFSDYYVEDLEIADTRLFAVVKTLANDRYLVRVHPTGVTFVTQLSFSYYYGNFSIQPGYYNPNAGLEPHQQTFHGKPADFFQFNMSEPRLFHSGDTVLVLDMYAPFASGFFVDYEPGAVLPTPVFTNPTMTTVNTPNGLVDRITVARTPSNLGLIGFTAGTEISYTQTTASIDIDVYSNSLDPVLFSGVVAFDASGHRSLPSTGTTHILSYTQDLNLFNANLDIRLPDFQSSVIHPDTHQVHLELPSFTKELYLKAFDSKGRPIKKFQIPVVSAFSVQGPVINNLQQLLPKDTYSFEVVAKNFQDSIRSVNFEIFRKTLSQVAGLRGDGLPVRLSGLDSFGRLRLLNNMVVSVYDSSGLYDPESRRVSVRVIDEGERVQELTFYIGSGEILVPNDVARGVDGRLYAILDNYGVSYVYRAVSEIEGDHLQFEKVLDIPGSFRHIFSQGDFLLMPGSASAFGNLLEGQMVIVRMSSDGNFTVGLREVVYNGNVLSYYPVNNISGTNTTAYLSLSGSNESLILGLSNASSSSIDVSLVASMPYNHPNISALSTQGETGLLQQIFYAPKVVDLIPLTDQKALALVGEYGSGSLMEVKFSSGPASTPVTLLYEPLYQFTDLRSRGTELPPMANMVKRGDVIYMSDGYYLIRLQNGVADLLSPADNVLTPATPQYDFVDMASLRVNYLRAIPVPDSAWNGPVNMQPPGNHWLLLTDEGDIIYFQLASGIAIRSRHFSRFKDLKLDYTGYDSVYALDETGKIYRIVVQMNPLEIEFTPLDQVPGGNISTTMHFERSDSGSVLIYSVNHQLFRRDLGGTTLLHELSSARMHFTDLHVLGEGRIQVAIAEGFSDYDATYHLASIENGILSLSGATSPKPIIFDRRQDRVFTVVGSQYGELDREPWLDNYLVGNILQKDGLIHGGLPHSTYMYAANSEGNKLIAYQSNGFSTLAILHEAQVANLPLPSLNSFSVAALPQNTASVGLGAVLTISLDISNCDHMCMPVASIFSRPIAFMRQPDRTFTANVIVGTEAKGYTESAIRDLVVVNQAGFHRLASSNSGPTPVISNGIPVNVSLGAMQFTTHPDLISLSVTNQSALTLSGFALQIFGEGFSTMNGVGFTGMGLAPNADSQASVGISTSLTSMQSFKLQLSNPSPAGTTATLVLDNMDSAQIYHYHITIGSQDLALPLALVGLGYDTSEVGNCPTQMQTISSESSADWGYLDSYSVLIFDHASINSTCSVALRSAEKKRNIILSIQKE